MLRVFENASLEFEARFKFFKLFEVCFEFCECV